MIEAKEEVIELYRLLDQCLKHMPDDEMLSDDENVMYEDMTNLKQSMIDAGYQFKLKSKKK
jgi:NADH:ubiquinone oxidoreductase subunit D